jgi:hypothetical protein
VFLDECMQLLGGGIAAGKVKLAQGFYDPGIKRECLGVGVGEEEDAVSNLGADAGQALELSQSVLAANPLTKEEQAKVIEAAIQKLLPRNPQANSPSRMWRSAPSFTRTAPKSLTRVWLNCGLHCPSVGKLSILIEPWPDAVV